MKEETKVNKFMVSEKLPKELSDIKAIIEDLNCVVSQPVIGQSAIDKITQSVSLQCLKFHIICFKLCSFIKINVYLI